MMVFVDPSLLGFYPASWGSTNWHPQCGCPHCAASPQEGPFSVVAFSVSPVLFVASLALDPIQAAWYAREYEFCFGFSLSSCRLSWSGLYSAALRAPWVVNEALQLTAVLLFLILVFFFW